MFFAVAARLSRRNHSLTARFVPKLASLAELGKPWVLWCDDLPDCCFSYEDLSGSQASAAFVRHQTPSDL
jgi:hypothetical protein